MNPNVRGVAWLTADQAREYLGFSTLQAFHKFVQRERARVPQRLKVSWLAGRMRFRAANLDACIEDEQVAVDQRVPLRVVARRGK
jgi:hypothetical protein